MRIHSKFYHFLNLRETCLSDILYQSERKEYDLIELSIYNVMDTKIANSRYHNVLGDNFSSYQKSFV